MATSTALIPLSEYLNTSYRPDCDYIDGEVQERNLGEEEHSDLQTNLIELLLTPQNKPHIRANAELRVQVKPENFRVPDVCVRLRSAPSERFLRQPPLLCIEVLSPSDTVLQLRQRVHDFLQMGVPEVWVLDSKARTVTVYSSQSIVEHSDGSLTVPGTPVVLQIAEIFAVLDDYEK